MQYKEENGHLVQTKSKLKFWHPTYLYNYIQEYKYDFLLDVNKEKRWKLMKLYLTEVQDAFHKHYPNTKFVVLIYDYLDVDLNVMWNELVDEGFFVYKISDIAGFNPGNDDRYRLPKKLDKYQHPNRAAWQRIIPELTKVLNLN